ncbi:hypothetical protein GGS21DRAFT_161500 [Xylaria nigripes]|nr:hypothetical protein GGS21DRAFT_161500 [Xylaria nigripes]
MFHSWTLKPDGTISERPRMFDPGTGKTSCPQACDHCRLKKVKCTGEKSGCQRCRALSRACSYSQPSRAQVQAASNGFRGRRQDQRESAHWNDTRQDQDAYSPTENTAKRRRSNDSSTTQRNLSLVNTNSSRTSSPKTSSTASPTEHDIPLPPLLWTPEGEVDLCFDEGSTSTPFSTGFDEFIFGSGAAHDAFSNPAIMTLDGGSEGSMSIDDHPCLTNFWTTPSLNDIDTPPQLQDLSSDQPSQGQQQNTENHRIFTAPRASWDFDTICEPSIALSSPSSSDSTYFCQCLRRIILLMDEVEDMLREEPSRDRMPDLMLATLKEALNHIRSMLGCSKCTGSVANMTLLTFLVTNLSCLCQSASKLLKFTDRPTSDLAIFSHGIANDENKQGGNIRVRNYAIDSVAEYQTVVGGLLDLQVDELNVLIGQLLEIAKEPQANGMVRRLTVAKSMLARMNSSSISNIDKNR